MKSNRGRRVVVEHGPISNVLRGLDPVDQITISNICSRTYYVTVAWNSAAIKLPKDSLKQFPGILFGYAGFQVNIMRTYA